MESYSDEGPWIDERANAMNDLKFAIQGLQSSGCPGFVVGFPLFLLHPEALEHHPAHHRAKQKIVRALTYNHAGQDIHLCNIGYFWSVDIREDIGVEGDPKDDERR